jgi:tetratricopeptide (TPR) repeat protein
MKTPVLLLSTVLLLAPARPSSAQLCENAVQAFRKGEIPAAAEEARRCIANGDHTSQTYKLLALSSFLLQNFDDFVANMEKAIEINPSDGDAHYHLGRYLYEKKLYRDAVTRFETAIKLDPQNYRAFYFLGLCKQADHDEKGAAEDYKRAIQIIDRGKLQFGWPFADLGDLLSMQGDLQSALSWAYRGTRNDPALPYTHYVYALILLKQEPTAEVEQSLQRALKLDPGYAQAYFLLGRYYTKSGEKEKAKIAYARFEELKKNPAVSPYGVRR